MLTKLSLIHILSDMGILSHVTPELVRSLGERLRGAAAVVCDPCLPSETVAAVIREADVYKRQLMRAPR